jgi:hypothetical protein
MELAPELRKNEQETQMFGYGFDRHPSDYLLDRLARTESVEESLSADREMFIG